MERENKRANWMNSRRMMQFYRQAEAEAEAAPLDEDFLSDPSLGRYAPYRLKETDIPESIRSFLTQVGLPNRFLDWRSPDEEREEAPGQAAPGMVFWLSCLRIREVKRKKYLIIGEARELSRSCITSGYGTPQEQRIWNKGESCTYAAAETKTGAVWTLTPSYDETSLTFVNSSLEQYLLAMAYWRGFYPGFAARVRDFTEKHPEKTELDYVFSNRRALYAPFRRRLEALDPEAAKKRSGYWQLMCDLSRY